MMKRFTLTLMLSFIAQTQAASVIILQGDQSDFGRKFFSGFSSVVTESIKAFHYDISKDRAILNQIKSLQPDLVVTIGKAPVEALVTMMPTTPFIVADYYSPSLVKKPNVVLTEQSTPTDEAISLMLKFLPDVKNVGTIYNPQYSQETFNLLVQSATKKKIRIASIKASNPKDVASYITAFAGKIDAYFSLRDASLSNRVASAAIYDFSEKNKIPVISLDPSHQGLSALIMLSIDPIQLGIQAWEISKIILKDKKIPQMPSKLDPSELILSVSLKAVSVSGTGLQILPKFLQDTTDMNYSVRVIR